jgi:hypothetical protein
MIDEDVKLANTTERYYNNRALNRIQKEIGATKGSDTQIKTI